MIVLFDSWAWIEYLLEGPKKDKVRALYSNARNRIITTQINLYEVYAKVLKEKGVKTADEVISKIAANAEIIDLSTEIIKDAARLKVEKGFGMADSMILATAINNNAKIITGDPDFKNVKEVEVELL